MIINTNYDFLLTIYPEDNQITCKMQTNDNESTLKDAKIILDDQVNYDTYSMNIEYEEFTAKSYVKVNKKSVKVFQKPFTVDYFYYEYNASKIVISNSISFFYNEEISDENSYFFLETGILPPSKTILENVKKVEPGELISISLINNKLKLTSKWLTPFWLKYIEENRESILKKNDINELLKKSLDISLKKCKPKKISLLLSSGLDSSILSYELGRKKDDIKKLAFTAWYDTKEGKNEIKFSRIRAEKFGFEHRGFLFSEKTFEKSLNEITKIIDQPISDPPATLERSLVNYSINEASSYIVSGELADTLFGGGNTFFAERYLNLIKIMRPLLGIGIKNDSYKRKLRAAISGKDAFQRQMEIWLSEEAASKNYGRLKELSSFVDDRLINVSAFQLFTVRTQIDHSKIHFAKKNSDVFYSVPFENMKVAEYGLALPRKLKVRNFQTKYLLRQKYGKKIPGKKSKQSYSPPVFLWLDDYYLKNGYKTFPQNKESFGEKGPEFGAKIWRYYIFNRWYLERYK